MYQLRNVLEVKQNVRNRLTQRPELLPYFFQLTLHDALTFNPDTLDGGPNGSLRFELEREGNRELQEAHEAIESIRALQRQDMSYADTCAFAGAVAVEITGGPRIVIQLGREDAKDADPEGKSNLFKPGASASDLRTAFESAGLNGARDVVLLHGAIGSLADIGQSRTEKMKEVAVDDEDEEQLEDLDDVTYGKVTSTKRGAVLVSSNVSQLTLGGEKFSNAYLKAILKAKDLNQLSQRDQAILGDKSMFAEVQKYAGNNGKFTNDVADLFQQISLLGSSYESLKLQS
ncbi:l-ascorbate peroxidase [Gracilaria domingensis]|nr:l-ascorbate peroxidase [Gracilaria domingensis]